MSEVEIRRGLKDVYFDRSRVCYIDGRAGELRYRGYSIHDLAERSTFEETCHLLLYGELPTREQLERFTAELKAARTLRPAIYEVLSLVKNAHPMDALRTAVSALVVAGTEATLHAAITAAVAALSGPAHGGAAENVMRMAQEIGDPANAAEYVMRKRANREAVMGFGHRVYRAEDPRARHMRAGVEQLSREMGEPKWYQILAALVEAMKPYARHGVNVNVDFYAGVVYYLNGIPADLFVPIFAVGRVPGWTVQVLEQMENNILIRPLTLYNGPPARDYVPIDER